MKKVITYGTYDLLHYGHIRLLERAKSLGDYLIVGVTSDDYDKSRGKINVQQSLMERIEAIRATGIADEIIVEEYEGQKIDDIRKYSVDIFTVGSDWKGKFDYLNEYCQVVYLDRTNGISSSEIRAEKTKIRIGIVGSTNSLIGKFIKESKYVNGISISGIYSTEKGICNKNIDKSLFFNTYDDLLNNSDALYICSAPTKHYDYIKKALGKEKHILCESPITMSSFFTKELFDCAKDNNCVLLEGIKTIYSTAYQRLLLLIKTGIIGKVISVDTICTSLSTPLYDGWSGFSYWGSTALLPAVQIFGTNIKKRNITLIQENNNSEYAKIDLIYANGFATIKFGNGVKSEGELVISGTKGYVYVPAPWWKMDYFEVRFEDSNNNKRYFYQLDGEGIRNEISYFINLINFKKNNTFINEEISIFISSVMEEYKNDNIDYVIKI